MPAGAGHPFIYFPPQGSGVELGHASSVETLEEATYVGDSLSWSLNGPPTSFQCASICS